MNILIFIVIHLARCGKPLGDHDESEESVQREIFAEFVDCLI